MAADVSRLTLFAAGTCQRRPSVGPAPLVLLWCWWSGYGRTPKLAPHISLSNTVPLEYVCSV